MIFKQTQIVDIIRLFFSISFLFVITNLSAQIEITTDRNNANYEVGETALFEVTSSQSGTVSYIFKHDNDTPIISSGTIDISSGETVSIPFLGVDAEVIICEATFDNDTERSAVVFSANAIPTLSEEPEDFDVFWADQVTDARQIDLDTEISYDSEDDDVTNYSISIAIPDNRRMYGYITIPKEGDNFPAVITLPSYGASANVASPQELVADRGKAISVSLSIHNVEADEADPEAYSPNDISSREGYYYRYAILGIVRVIDYLFTRDDFDGQNVCLTGASQGAGLSLIVAGLDDRVKAISISNPALSRHGAYITDKASGFPNYLDKSATQFGTPEHFALTADASRYYDAIFFAKRFEGNVLANVSYNDLITPAATSFAAIKELRGKTIITHSTTLDHSHPSEYWGGRFDFWRKNFPTMSNPPYFTDTGYWIEAGADTNTEIGVQIDLNAQVFYNDDINTSFPVKWELVEGPDNAYFSNPNISNPTVSFTEPGIYTLKVTATDDSELEDEDFFHTVSDFILIEVIDPQNPPVDLIQPTCILSFLEFDANGNILINVDFSESIIGLEASDFNVANGNVTNLVADGENYILTIESNSTGNIVVSLPEGSVIDAAANVNLNSNEISVFIEPVDNIPPTCTLSFIEINEDGDIEIEVLFSEDVTGLDDSDFDLTNGEVLSLTGSGSEYLLIVTPLTSGDVIVSLDEDEAEDAAENGNLESNEISVFIEPVDNIPPTCTLSFIEINEDGDIEIEVLFSEDVTGLDESDFDLTNGEVLNLTGNGSEYLLLVTPLASGDVIVSLDEDEAEDAAENGNLESNEISVFIEPVDNIPPTCTLSFIEINEDGDIEIEILFSEDVTGLDEFDFDLTNGEVLSLTGSGNEYLLLVTPLDSGDVIVSLDEDEAEDAAENGNLESNEVSVFILTCILSFVETNEDGDIEFEVLFSEEVTGLESTDFALINGEVLSLTGSGSAYILLVTPLASGDVIVSLPENVVSDTAGNGNLWSNEINIFIEIFDNVPPTCTLSFVEINDEGNLVIDVSFSEEVTGLESTEFALINGEALSLTGSGSAYILLVTPLDIGDVLVSLPENVASDAAGNGNLWSNEIEIFIESVDDVSPTCTLSFIEINGEGNLVIEVLFSEDVTGLDEPDFDLTNGEVLSLTGSGSEYLLIVTPLDSGDVIVSLSENTVEDTAENGNIASNEISVFVNISSIFNPRTNRVEVYPNPASANFYLALEKYAGESAKVKIYNELGQLFRSINIKEIPNEAQVLGTEGMLTGIYFITIELSDGVLLSEKLTVFRN